MQNEITAEMLAQRIAADAGRPEYNISLHLFCERFLLATRALAALQCDKKHARMVADAATYRALAALQAEQPKPEQTVMAPMSLYSKAAFEAAYPPDDKPERKFDPGQPVLDEAGKLQGFKASAKPGRVRCWMARTPDGEILGIWGNRPNFVVSPYPHTVTRGWFTADEGQGNG